MTEKTKERVNSRAKNEVPYIKPPHSNTKDSKDEEEDRAFADGRDLSREREVSRHDRSEGIHKTLSIGCKIVLWFAIVAIILMGASWIYHIIMPENSHYLGENQVADIKAYLFSGAVGAFMSKYLERFLA